MEREKILLDHITTEFSDTLEKDFGIKTVDSDKGRWYELSWEEFKQALTSRGAGFNSCSEADWQEYFQLQKEKVQQLRTANG